ncbi:MAG TPA: hypothetical protein VGX92_14515 [Pyrinomonadaceae bacterium]|jgi:hypothetical protein|nr:hypothetical protein [Pyrinomonadaceae bacterium]
MIKRRLLRRVAFRGSFALLLSLLSAVLVILPACAPEAASAAVGPRPQGFDPEGEFNIVGDPPRGLSEVSAIELLRDPARSFLNPHAGVYTTGGVTYRFRTLTVTRDRFAFATVTVNGVSYSFTGRFLRGGVYAEMNSDQWGKPILEGRLTKLRGGRKVAKANLKFSYFGGT